MTDTRYPTETLHPDYDDGTIVENVKDFADAVIGRRIVKAEQRGSEFTLTLDDGTEVSLFDTDDCCAYTELENFFLGPDSVDHVITGVGTTDQYDTWHVFADMGDVLRMNVGWSCGNPFYYSYGFQIRVKRPS